MRLNVITLLLISGCASHEPAASQHSTAHTSLSTGTMAVGESTQPAGGGTDLQAEQTQLNGSTSAPNMAIDTAGTDTSFQPAVPAPTTETQVMPMPMGGTDAPTVQLGTVTRDLTLGPTDEPDHPHPYDLYMPANAPTRAVFFLHGALGTKERVAQNLGLVGSGRNAGVDQSRIDEMGVAWVIPQGQALDIDDANGNPRNINTWSNRVMMSGANDVAFLLDLRAEIQRTTGVAEIVLAGHSNGGMMTHRMWCDVPESFDLFVGISGPPSVAYDSEHVAWEADCVGTRPYWSIVGSQDSVLNASELEPYWSSSNADGPPWLRLSENVINPRRAHQRLRVPLVCSDSGTADPRGDVDQSDARKTIWSACGNTVRLWWVEQNRRRGGHTIADLEADAGFNLAEALADWTP